MRPLRLINPPHPSLALPNHVAYKPTEKEIQAMHRRLRETKEQEDARAAAAAAAASPASAFNSRAAMPHAPAASRPISPSRAPTLPRVLSKAEQASAAVAYSRAHSVTVVQALKTLGFAT